MPHCQCQTMATMEKREYLLTTPDITDLSRHAALLYACLLCALVTDQLAMSDGPIPGEKSLRDVNVVKIAGGLNRPSYSVLASPASFQNAAIPFRITLRCGPPNMVAERLLPAAWNEPICLPVASACLCPNFQATTMVCGWVRRRLRAGVCWLGICLWWPSCCVVCGRMLWLFGRGFRRWGL